MMSGWLKVGLVLWMVPSFAGSAILAPGTGGGVTVTYESSIKGQALQLLGSGIREKKVAFFTADVYEAKAYASVKPAVETAFEAAQAEVLAAPVKAIELTFLRDVSAEKIRDAFTESLKENGVVLNERALEQKVLDRIVNEVKKTQTLRLLGTQHAVNETLVLETPDSTFAIEGPQVASNFFKIWFGRTEETKLRNLQLQLLGRKAG